MKCQRNFLYILLFLVAMLLSAFAKRAVFPSRAPLAALTLTRNFMFSSSKGNSAKSNGNKNDGWQNGSGDSAASSGISATPASASHNYDKASLDKLVLYNVAVAFQAKNRKESNKFLKKDHKTPAELLPSGEDNLFVSEQSKEGYLALGVADGVGGWSEAGYDSSAISRELCHSIKLGFEASTEKELLTPQQLLMSAFENVQVSPKVEIGGTTACLGIFTPDHKLKVANLGDSWCGLFREYKLVQETKFQTHNFNTPFQLAKIPKQVLRQAELQGKRYIIDSPEMADEYEWDLKSGDIVLFATDGVTDNVVPQDMEIFLKDQFDHNNAMSDISRKFVKEVVKVSKDPNFPSSFAQELSRLTGQRYLGGKEDDITVVMVKVL